MSELDNQPIHKYKVGDTFDFNGIVEIVETCGYNPVKRECMYNVRMQDGRICEVEESWIDGGINHFGLDENGRVKGKEYAVSYIASAPEELKVGDRVEVVKAVGCHADFFGRVGIVSSIEHAICHVNFGTATIGLNKAHIRKIPDTASFEKKDNEPWNVAMFRNVTGEMADTYARKNATYNDSFGKSVEKYGFISALTRMSDKFNRVENLILGAKNEVPDESLEDTLIDLACYSVMTLVALRGTKINDVDFENEN